MLVIILYRWIIVKLFFFFLGLAKFIPAHHRQQFSEMLRSLTGSVSVTCEDSDEVSGPSISGTF